MSTAQLNLFSSLVGAAPAAPTKKPKAAATGLTIEPSNHDYLAVCLRGVWVGSMRALTGSLYCLYYPGERGVCGFGGPSAAKAAAVLLECYTRDGMEVPRG